MPPGADCDIPPGDDADIPLEVMLPCGTGSALSRAIAEAGATEASKVALRFGTGTPSASASRRTSSFALGKRSSGSRLHARANHASKRGPRCDASWLGGGIGSYTICPISAAMPSALQ